MSTEGIFGNSFGEEEQFNDEYSDEDLEQVLAVLIEKLPNVFLDHQDKAPPKKRQRRVRTDLWASEWGRLLNHHNTMIPGTFEYVKFRLRFRVPFPLFKMRLIPAIREAKIFNAGRSSYIPLEFKVMIALRIIGRDTDCDTASELSGVPKSTCNTILKQFCAGFVEHFYDKFVYFPDADSDELKKLMDVFGRVGFPGAMGSMDVTHFRWLSCPKNSYNFCKGKYPFPTLACQAIVDHNRRILFLSELYDGRENDKNITSDDEFTYAIMMGKFNSVKFKLYDEHGVVNICEGGYIIVDGGYQNVPCFVDPLHDANGHKEVHWSEFIESVRKDVECTFGILKSRFRILRNGLQYDREVSTNIVKTCAILHNMLLAYDGLDEFKWNKTGEWEGEDPDMSDETIYFHEPTLMDDDNEHVIPVHRFIPVRNDTTAVGRRFRSNNRNDYSIIHECLVSHFFHQWRYGQLQWPLRFDGKCKSLHPMKRVQDALAVHTYDSLYVKPSDLVLVHEGRHRPDVNMGDGLFCSMLLPSARHGIKLAEFKGIKISQHVMVLNDVRGKGGYVITSSGELIDCYSNAKNGTCKASMANSARNSYNRSEGRMAVNNCTLKNGALWTKPNTTIPMNRELLWAYHNSYRFPQVPALP
jgi:hypothetical protein